MTKTKKGAKQRAKLIDWIANEVCLVMATAYFRGDLKLTIFPEGVRPDYILANKIAKKLKLPFTP